LISFIIIGWGLAWIHDLLLKERNTTSNLRKALAEIKILEGIVPICASCKKIRNQHNDWQQMEAYISEHSKAQFSHGLCPECAKRYLKEAGLASAGTEPR
jgi:sigma-B regulation protein RsbU (phosphoserine phosphatase)